MNNQILEWITAIFNRSKNQAIQLYELLDNNLELYIRLELKIKNLHLFTCPGSVEEVYEIMNQEVDKEWFKLPLNK